MPEKISILKESGETLNSNVVSIFTIPDSGKKYIITTENAVDPHGLTVLHVSEVNDGNLTKVATDEEWNSIKTIMRAIISGNAGSYQYAPLLTEANANGQYSRDISVSSSASKQMIDNYAAGRELLKANETPTEETNEALEPAPEGSTIFPDKGTSNVDQEVSPGIEEVEVPATEVQEEANDVPVTEEAASAENAPVTEEAAPAETAPVETAPVEAEQVEETTPAVVNEETVPVEETPVQEETSVQTEETPVQEVAPVQTEEVPVQEVTQTVPVQSAPVFDQNATPSFDPNATFDEVVVAAQEVFVEGVRNLVQTLTEKIYRDLHTKEAELNQREDALNEREKLINDQMTSLLNNLTNQFVQPTTQSAPVETQPVTETVPVASTAATTEQPVTPVVV